MEISFSQSFLDSLERIDNKVVIDKFKVDEGELQDNLHIICHGKEMQVCVEGVSGECSRLDFYYGEEIGFTITGEGIVMNPERTIFEFNLPSEPKATIECPGLTEDTKFLEGAGPELGNSLYKDIPVSSESLVWKETLGKYIVDRGIQDNHSYDVELLDTKSGVLEERPIKFKSYRNITIEQGNLEVEMIKKSVVVKHDVYSEISDSSFLVWDSPMIDAKVDLDKEPTCINMIGEYVDPGNIIFGNTDCFQFTNYSSSLVGFKITGTEGSKVEVLFNRESSGGSFTSFEGTIGENGSVEIRFSDLPYLHFNGIRASGPSRVSEVETIMYLEETVDEYSPNPDKTYVAKLNNIDCVIEVNGVADYVEYEKYLGEIHEIGRGKEHIDNIPGLTIKPVENSGLSYEMEELEKQIKVNYNSGIEASIRYSVFQISIDNNIEVNGNIITTSSLIADYKVKIEQTGIIWKIYNSPNYVNGEDGYGIFLFGYESGSSRHIEILTNDPRAEFPNSLRAIQGSEGQEIFKIIIEFSRRIVDGDWWGVYDINIKTKSENTGNTWRPRVTDTEDPCLITFKFLEIDIPSISLYAIQQKNIDNQIEVWEETIIPGKFTKVTTDITLLNTMTKNFIVVKNGVEGAESLNWYYYDLSGSNRFYMTDQNFQVSNVGTEYLVSPGTTLLDLGTGEVRSIYGRVINANRSDLVGSIGTFVVTESSSFPKTWRDLIDNNTTSLEVKRELNNIYIQVGKNGNLKNEDYEVEVNSIGTFDVEVSSNFKYVIQTYGYVKIYPDESFSGESGYDLPTRLEVFSTYNQSTTYTFALIELDEDSEMGDSYIEIRSGSLSRKITLKVEGPKKEHDYVLTGVSKPNIIRIFANGTISPETSNKFLYTSTTTPKIEVSGINKYQDETKPLFYNQGGKYYSHHESTVPISVQSSIALSYSKYPMKSFGYIREMSQDYSDSEVISTTGTTSYLEYPLYMKGKEHYLWCVETLGSFSSITEPADTRYDMTIDAKGSSGKTIYIVSRYSNENQTFITESPEETEFKIKRDVLEAEIKISPQQNIGLDERSQIEYAIPIQVSCNVENNRGNIFLGSLDYKATTKITDDSLSDVIEVDSNIATTEGINAQYIKDYITSDRTQNLSIMIFQLGTDKDVFDVYSNIPDLSIEGTSNYFIPEIGNSYTLIPSSLNVTLTPLDPITPAEEYLVTCTSESDSKYFLVKVDSLRRVRAGRLRYYWFDANDLPMNVIKDISYSLNIDIDYKKEDSGTITTGTKTFNTGFKKYGCHYGFYVEGRAGFGNNTEGYSGNGLSAGIEVSSDGGSILIHAGIFYAVNGIESTEALMVPAEYKFIGENKPIDFSWENGNLDDSGNLRITLPPRTRDENGIKEYILQVTQPHEYYPLNQYVIFYQESLHGSEPDTEKEDYRLMFLDDEVNILSNGTVEKDDDKFYFVSNLPESDFEKVEFGWKMRDPNEGNIPEIDGLNVLEEVERSYKNGQGYVKFKFRPNGVNVFIDALLYAKFTETDLEIGSINVKQGYFSLMAKYCSPYTEYEVVTVEHSSNYNTPDNPMSRLSSSSYSYLYSFTRQHSYLEVSTSETPCKSNDDNANSQKYKGRGVFKLTCQKKEYYDEEAETEDLNTIFKDSIIEYISPKHVLDSYGIKFITESVDDFDAKVNTRFNNSGYATNKRFSQYCPYIELSYSVKEEYLRSDKSIIASGKITLRHPDSGEFVDFYILFNNFCIGSNEPVDINTLKFSDNTVKFDSIGGIKQVSYSPASFGSMMSLSLVDPVGWASCSLPSGSNYIEFSALENKSIYNENPNEDYPASYRTTQAEVIVRDPRDNYVMGTFYVDMEQEPDTYFYRGKDDPEPTPTPTGYNINLTFVNNRSNSISFTGRVQLSVRLGTFHTTVMASVPGSNLSSNDIIIPANSTSSVYIASCDSILEDMSKLENGDIDDYDVLWYDSSTGHTSNDYLAPYSFVGENTDFKKNGNYTITFNS